MVSLYIAPNLGDNAGPEAAFRKVVDGLGPTRMKRLESDSMESLKTPGHRELAVLKHQLGEERRAKAGLEALAVDRDRQIQEWRRRWTSERLHVIWLETEVVKREARIEELQRSGLERPSKPLMALAKRSMAWLLAQVRPMKNNERKPACETDNRSHEVKEPIAPPAPSSTTALPTASSLKPSETDWVNDLGPERPRFAMLGLEVPETSREWGPLIESVVAQDYPEWKLGLGSLLDATAIEEWTSRDRRIERIDIGGAESWTIGWNRVLERLGGEYLILIEPGSLLAPGALEALAQAIRQHGEVGPVLIYGDEVGCGESEGVWSPYRRPGWSPELLLSTPYMGRLLCIKRSSFEESGGFRPGFEKCAAYELSLRITEGPGEVVHVPRILASSAVEPDAGNTALDDARVDQTQRAIQEALVRRGSQGQAQRTEFALRENREVFEIEFPHDGPRVTILIPTKDRHELLRRCLDSIVDQTLYRNYEIIVIDNESQDPRTAEYLESLNRIEIPCRVVAISNDGLGFNYARIHNRVVERLNSSCAFVVFLNNDTEVIRPEWLSQMVGYGGMAGVGVVGARLLYPDGRIQHAGMLTDLHDGLPAHAFKLAPWWDRGYLDQAFVGRNCSAVTAACMLVRRDRFLEVGGFDENRFAVAFNDVDLCLRLGRRGYRCVYAPRAELLHYEGASRGFGDDPMELEAYLAQWGGHRDPYRNPHLKPGDERMQPAVFERF